MSETLTQPKITGYRQLTQQEADLMNAIKQIGVDMGAFIEELRGIPDVDHRWVNIGTTDLQKGLMALTRAVAKQSTF